MNNKIKIKDLLPFLKDGWVAMDKDGRWFWYGKKPSKCVCTWSSCEYQHIGLFDIEPADDWEKSLMKCGKKPELKLEVGKFYRTREGRKAIVLSNSLSKKYPFWACIVGEIQPYKVNIKGFTFSEDLPDEFDIISEWEV